MLCVQMLDWGIQNNPEPILAWTMQALPILEAALSGNLPAALPFTPSRPAPPIAREVPAEIRHEVKGPEPYAYIDCPVPGLDPFGSPIPQPQVSKQDIQTMIAESIREILPQLVKNEPSSPRAPEVQAPPPPVAPSPSTATGFMPPSAIYPMAGWLPNTRR